MTADGGVLERWVQAVAAAFSVAKADRARELRGDRRVRAFDDRGLHSFSLEWGRVLMLEELAPGLMEIRLGRAAGVAAEGEPLTLPDEVLERWPRVGGEPLARPLDPVTLRQQAARAAEVAFAAELREHGEQVWTAA